MGVLPELFANRGDDMDGTIIDPDDGSVYHFDSFIDDDTPEDEETATSSDPERYAKPFDEKLHPRGKAGKFARKGTVKPPPEVNGQR